MKNDNLVNEVNFGALGKGALAATLGGAALYGANRLGKKVGKFVKKNPDAVSKIGSSAGQIGSSLINALAPVIKQVGPAVAKDLLKKKYNIDIPDSVINMLSNNPSAPSSASSSTTPTAAAPGATPPVLATSPTGTASMPKSPVTTASPVATSSSSTSLSKDTIDKIKADPVAQDIFYGRGGSNDKNRETIKKKYGLKDDDTLDTYLLTAMESLESMQPEVVKEFVGALAAGAEALAPAIARQIALQAGTDLAAKAINKKLQQKNGNKPINNNEMEESKKKKKKIIAKEGLATGTLGAVAGGLMGGTAGAAALGGLIGGAAPGAVKEIKGAIKGEDEEDRKKKKKKKIKESSDIVKFIHNISQKNYAEANKYLESIISSKLKERIENSLNNNIF
jgi:uncharacterized membrane protein